MFHGSCAEIGCSRDCQGLQSLQEQDCRYRVSRPPHVEVSRPDNSKSCLVRLPRLITAVPSFLPVTPCRSGIPFEWTGAGNRPINLINLDKSDFIKRFEVVLEYPLDHFGERTAGAQWSAFDMA